MRLSPPAFPASHESKRQIPVGSLGSALVNPRVLHQQNQPIGGHSQTYRHICRLQMHLINSNKYNVNRIYKRHKPAPEHDIGKSIHLDWLLLRTTQNNLSMREHNLGSRKKSIHTNRSNLRHIRQGVRHTLNHRQVACTCCSDTSWIVTSGRVKRSEQA